MQYNVFKLCQPIICMFVFIQPFDLAHLIGDPNPAMNNPEDRVTNGRSNDETAGVTTSISDDGCRTWIIPPPDFVDDQDGAATANQSDVALRYGTGGNPVFDYRFEELQVTTQNYLLQYHIHMLATHPFYLCRMIEIEKINIGLKRLVFLQFE